MASQSTARQLTRVVVGILLVSTALADGYDRRRAAFDRHRAAFPEWKRPRSTASTSTKTTTTSTTSGTVRASASASASSNNHNCNNNTSEVKTEVKSPAPSEDFIVVREQSIGGGAPPSEVPVEAPEVAELTEIGCEDGEFLDASNTCQVCDAHCNVDRCIDGMGCLACYAGYYYVRPEAGKPFECRQCTIPHCVDCQDGATDDGQTPKCIQCENGYRLASDSRVCYPIVPPSPVTEQITTPAPIVDEQQPVTIVDEQEPATIADEKEPAAIRTGSSQTEDSTTETSIETEAPSACPGNSFMSIADNGCVKCDMHAIPGGCKDYIGCLGCMRGFFRRRAASNYPFSCYPCTIANCAVCEDDIPFYAPLKCRACENTYQVDERTGLCVPV